MIKAFIRLQYEDKEYQNDICTLNQQDFELFVSIVEKAVKGESKFLMLTNNGKDYYFPKAILEKSIITINKLKQDVKGTST